MNIRPIQILRIVSYYLIFGFLWIIFSDYVLDSHELKIETMSRIQSVKGISFVLVSGFVISILLWRESLEKDALLAEIHHRVKNNLAVISAFLELQVESASSIQGNPPNPEDFRRMLRSTLRRIKTMSITHNILYKQESYINMDMPGLIDAVWNYCLTSHDPGISYDLKSRIQLRNDVNAKTVSLVKAVPIALILTELFSNSLQHGFSEGDEYPEIRLCISYEHKTFLVHYHDNGKGIIDKKTFTRNENPKGLGFFIIKTLTKQLNGDIVIDNGEGLGFIIRIPDKKV